MLRKKHIPTGICLAILLALFSYKLWMNHRALGPLPNIETSAGIMQTREFWTKEIQSRGGKVAYKEFLHAYEPYNIGDRHTAAHIFGGALYAVEGVSGLAVCDASFSFGCFHEFLGKAIAAEGLQIVPALNQACFDSLGPGLSLSCSHGLGHGIVSYLGYDSAALVKGLSACADLQHSDPIGGCFGGVFMEYNMRTMGSLSGMPVRTKKDGGLMHPCDIVPPEYQRVCYYWQPQWWHQALIGDGTPQVVFTEMGDSCRAIPSSYIGECFEGIGTVVGIATQYDAAAAAALCDAAAKNAEQLISCRKSGAGAFNSEPTVRNTAKRLCDGLPEKDTAVCMNYAKGINNSTLDVAPKQQ